MSYSSSKTAICGFMPRLYQGVEGPDKASGPQLQFLTPGITRLASIPTSLIFMFFPIPSRK